MMENIFKPKLIRNYSLNLTGMCVWYRLSQTAGPLPCGFLLVHFPLQCWRINNTALSPNIHNNRKIARVFKTKCHLACSMVSPNTIGHDGQHFGIAQAGGSSTRAGCKAWWLLSGRNIRQSNLLTQKILPLDE